VNDRYWHKGIDDRTLTSNAVWNLKTQSNRKLTLGFWDSKDVLWKRWLISFFFVFANKIIFKML
jgi:hypothetical protein